MDTIYIESRPCQDGKHEAWHDTEDGRTWLRFNSIAACMRYGKQYEFHIVVVRH